VISPYNLNEAHTFCIELPLTTEFFNLHQYLLDPKLAKAVYGRREEYVAGRACAKAAMEVLGVTGDIAFGEDRKPVWPHGIVGSITHSKKFVVASIGLADEFQSIGIDCEVVMTKAKFDSLSNHLATSDDLKLFNGANDDITATIIFSAKEALFKLINPLCHKFFGFDHATVKVIGDDFFEIELHSKLAEVSKFNSIYRGCYKVLNNQIVTSLILQK
jgi:4'-phosphopantetheinyl transferase EntD